MSLWKSESEFRKIKPSLQFDYSKTSPFPKPGPGVGQRSEALRYLSSDLGRYACSPAQAACSIPLVRVLPAHQVALEGLYHGVSVPFGPVVVPEQIFDARPTPLTIKLAGVTLIKKFTMSFTHVLLVLFTVLDFHRPPLGKVGVLPMVQFRASTTDAI